ncbi:MAG: GxxExxY protein [Saprospiraceae bacterium]|nr:GxxExxY protein [Saprospiraceae bacterium]MCF8248965.1 GxxExxY protein [Saprospiraceae bacterium]MCF8279176.1 GxxExxY protein [Bacteroidales bacterium]MCF8310859.1 GxxExxY protein [Saprospiraceae bacterium]MCF8439553.1 GxxExxY protein [Saprospiraceae bacterium]
MGKTNDELNVMFKRILDICFKIHTMYGPGLLESFYEAVLSYELTKAGISNQRQVDVYVKHDEVNMGLGYRMDIFVENEILIELKSKEKLTEVDHKQTLTYMKLKGIRLGLLINFGVLHLKDGIHRKVNGF